MTRITIRSQGGQSAETATIEPGEALLIGRTGSDQLAERDAKITQTIGVASPNVSAQHLLIAHTAGALRMTDLGSRTGTWLQLSSQQPVTLAPVAALTVHLGPLPMLEEPGSAPRDAAWSSRESYVQAVTAAISAWLSERNVSTHIATLDKDAPVDSIHVGRFPITQDQDLVIVPTHTVEGDWLQAMAVVESYVTRQNAQFSAEEQLREDGLIIASAAMRRTVSAVVNAAVSGARTLLLIGPSGSGKEGLARCFHRHTRRAGAFVARNCAMFSKELARSELFGAERGAYTGSMRRIIGAVEAANEGTLFLDEIGELTPDVQSMLLRFLDRGEYERMGRYDRPCTADVRVISATNKDLRRAALQGDFRPDLWFRLSAQVIEVPPLRERFEDIVAYLHSRPYRAHASLFSALTPPAVELLRAHSWEGNFRELINFAERAIALPGRGPISAEACRQALDEGALQPVRYAATVLGPTEALDRAQDARSAGNASYELASAAFAEDYGVAAPRTWDEVKELIENYLKPVMFAQLSGCGEQVSASAIDLRRAADSLRADRGTASKQLERYLDRFASMRLDKR